MKVYNADDEVSLISSRIESNRMRIQNTTIDIINSSKKVNSIRDDSIKIGNSSKKILDQSSVSKYIAGCKDKV